MSLDRDPALPPPRPLQAFADPRALRRTAARRLMPAARVTIADTALAHRKLRNPGGGYTGPWKHIPYLIEPMEMQTVRRVSAVVFVAPAQSAKTEGVIVNAIFHGIVADPADMLLIQTTQLMARDFSRRKLRRLIDDHKIVADRLRDGKGGDNLLDKTFDGMILSIGHPTVSQFSGRSIPRLYLTDYDRLPLDIDGEGSAFDLCRKRSQTFGSRGMTVAESSPGHVVTVPKWKLSASAPHEAPPAPGILSLYNRGDRRQWYWTCPSCAEPFVGRFQHFRYDDRGDPGSRAASVVLICPVNGCVLPPSAKHEMNRGGRWVPEGMRLAPGGLLTGDARRTDVASFWLFGPAAEFQGWSQMVQRHIEALAEYDRNGDDAGLKATINTDQAEAYIPPQLAVEETVEAEVLADRAGPGFWRRVPAEARYLTASVDVQANRFEIIVRAWGEALESWVIDRRTVFKAKDEDRPIDPAKRSEDWDLLEAEILTSAYPVIGSDGFEMAIRRVAIDSGGKAGVTAEAYDFLRRTARKDRTRDGMKLAPRVVLTKGGSRIDAPRVVKSFPDSKRKDRKAAGRGEIPVWIFNTNRLKDELANQLSRDPGQRRCVYFAAELKDESPPHEFFEQLTAEERRPDGTWHKVRKRNEPIDLMVMAHVAALQSKADRINWDKPPNWARPGPGNPYITPIAVEDRAPAPDTTPATPPASSKPRRRRRRAAGGYITRGAR